MISSYFSKVFFLISSLRSSPFFRSSSFFGLSSLLRSSYVKGCLLSKVIICQRSSSVYSCTVCINIYTLLVSGVHMYDVFWLKHFFWETHTNILHYPQWVFSIQFTLCDWHGCMATVNQLCWLPVIDSLSWWGHGFQVVYISNNSSILIEHHVSKILYMCQWLI